MSVRTTFKLRGDFDVADAIAGRICEFSEKKGIGWIILCWIRKANCEDCQKEKSSSEKSRFHVFLRSLSRGS
jgi:hypothetical protein